MFDIVTIGSITRDNFLESDFNLIPWPRVSSGKAIIFPVGEKMSIRRVYSTIGGNSANASVTLSRQGFRAACFGKIGNDISGREIREKLQSEKVKPLLGVSKNVPTAYSAILLHKGERTILGYHGASDTLTIEDVPWRQLKSKWWYLSLAGESDSLLKPLLQFSKQHGTRVAFNPSGHHIHHRRRDILDSLKYLSFLVLNADEASELVGISFRKPKEVFKKLDKLTPGIVAVTDGPRGVMVSDGKYLYKAGIYKEKAIVDRTGAGDSFGSGFVAGLMKRSQRSKVKGQRFSQEDIKYAIRLASANATSVVEHVGATEGILRKSDFNASRWEHLPITVNKL